MRGMWRPAPTPTALDQSPRPSLTNTPGTCAELGTCAEQSGGGEASTSRAGRAGGAPASEGPAAESGRRRRRGAPDTLSEQATRDFKARQSSDTPLRYTRTPEPSGATAAEMAAATEAMVARQAAAQAAAAATAAAKVDAEAAAAKVAAVAAAQPMSCVAWRQTSGCSPTGRREPQGDKACNATLEPDASQAAAACIPGCNPMQSRLQSHAIPGLQRHHRARRLGCMRVPRSHRSPAAYCAAVDMRPSALHVRRRVPAALRRDLHTSSLQPYAPGLRPYASRCADECQRAAHYACVSWRAAQGCTADGPRLTSADQAPSAPEACTCTCTCACDMCMRIHARAHTHAHARTHTHAHINTHTHAHAPPALRR